jgi:hypothetical protein
MATDLKPYFDAVNSAQAEVDRIAHDVDTAMADGSDEGKLKALELQPELDAAVSKLDEVSKLYELRQKADRPNDIAKNYVPVSNAEDSQGDGSSQASVLTRQEYDKLSLDDRAKFIKTGGSLKDE